MVQAVRPAGADDGHLVDVLRHMGIPVRHPGAALAVLLESALGTEQRVAGGPHSGDRLAEGIGHGLSAQFGQLGLGVEQVEVAGSALHEQPDHRLGFGLMMRLFRRKRIGQLRGHEAVLLQHVGERDAGQAAAGALKELTP